MHSLLRFLPALIIPLTSCDQSERQPPEIRLEPEPSSVRYGDSAVLHWSAEGSDYCIARGDWVGNVKRSGSITLGPLKHDSTYTLDCYESGNLLSKTVTIKVGEAKIPTVRIDATPLNITYNGTTILTWNSENVTECEASGAWTGDKKTRGSYEITQLHTDSEFLMSCIGPQGSVSDSIQVNVFAPGIEVPYVRLDANPMFTPYQGSTTLSWTTEAADICWASGDWSGSKARTGSEIIPQLNQDSRFILSCRKAGGRGVEGRDAVEVTLTDLPRFSRQN